RGGRLRAAREGEFLLCRARGSRQSPSHRSEVRGHGQIVVALRGLRGSRNADRVWRLELAIRSRAMGLGALRAGRASGRARGLWCELRRVSSDALAKDRTQSNRGGSLMRQLVALVFTMLVIPAVAQTPLKVKMFPGAQSLPALAAVQQGMFERQGLKVEVLFT